MSKKQIVVGVLIIIPIILFTVLESLIFSNRVKIDELFIKNVLVQRDKIGERNLVWRKHSVSPDEEFNLSLAAISSSDFKRALASPKKLPEPLVEGTNKILGDIVRVSDNFDNYKFVILFSDYHGNKIFVDKRRNVIIEAFGSGFVIIDVSVFKTLNNEAELAAGIGHEVGHILLKQIFLRDKYDENLIPPFNWPVHTYYFGIRYHLFPALSYEGKRKIREEEEAYILAVQYCFRAGYDIRSLLELLKRERFPRGRITVVEEEIREIEKNNPTFRGVLFRHLTKEDFSKND